MSDTVLPLIDARPITFDPEEWECLYESHELRSHKEECNYVIIELMRKEGMTLVVGRMFDNQDRPIKSLGVLTTDAEDTLGKQIINGFWRVVGFLGVIEREFAGDVFASLPPARV